MTKELHSPAPSSQDTLPSITSVIHSGSCSNSHNGISTETSCSWEEFEAFAHVLQHQAEALEIQARKWNIAHDEFKRSRVLCQQCGAHTASASEASQFPYLSILQSSSTVSYNLQLCAEKLRTIAFGLLHSHYAYSHAEAKIHSLLNSVFSAEATAHPFLSFMAIAASGALGQAGYSAANNSPFKPIGLVTQSSSAHEGYMRGLSQAMGGKNVNQAAAGISKISEPLTNLIQGDKLKVKAVHPKAQLNHPYSIAESLANQERLGTGKLGAKYATVGIQRFTTADGSHSWLVTIPGTDGHSDSPLGWSQNVDLMSSDSKQREKADSAQFVAAAMRRAGISSTDKVAIVGHSQGGIIAATLASDPTHEFNIQHIVTAGSPIANHPLHKSTWSTSIEMNDELVSSLDGNTNPVGKKHLTVRGYCDTNPQELTHGMEYQQRAWKNAVDQNNHSVQKHDEHFRSIVSGTMDKNLYYEGRISH